MIKEFEVSVEHIAKQAVEWMEVRRLVRVGRFSATNESRGIKFIALVGHRLLDGRA